MKAGSNSYKIKNEIRQMLYLLYQHNKITKKIYSSHYNNGTPNYLFWFLLAIFINEKLKHEIEFIIKSNESLAEIKIKNEIE